MTQRITFDEWPFNGLMTDVIEEKIMESERKKAEAKDGGLCNMRMVLFIHKPLEMETKDKDERVLTE